MLRGMSINRRLILSHAFIAAAVLILGSAWYIRYEIQVARESLVTEMASVASVIGYNCVSSLLFLDEAAAGETLTALQEQGHISNGAVYDAEGAVFATYSRTGFEAYELPPATGESQRFGEEHLHLFRPISRDGQLVGTVYLRVSLEYLSERMRGYVQRAGIVLALGLLAALGLAALGGRALSQPIERMSEAARRISVSGDYGLRVEKQREDELGVLADGFNEMLTQIQQRDASLRVAQDVLEQRVAERTEELRQANEELQTSIGAMREARDRAEEANRSKSTFLANMSHEIRTPLNAILGFAEILGRQVADTGLQQHVVEIQRGGQRLLGLINDILDMSKAESGQLELEPRVMSTTAVFLDMQEVFAQRMAEKGLDFQVDVQGDLPPVIELDETRLRQVLVNFLDNAVKFTEAGFVRLSLAGEFGSEPGAEMQLTFAIADSGKGIALDQQERIFSAFVQQDGQSINEYGGTGLGLAMNRRLVEMMGGTLSVESEVGRGSTFTVVLPHVPVASGDLPGAAAEADALQAADAPSAGPPDESVAGDEAQDEIDLTRLPELCEALMTERSHWEQVWETQTINEVEELATRLAALGNEYGYSPLREWAVQLQAQAQAFDMASLPGTLGGFPEIVADAVARKAAVSEAHPG